MLTAGAHPSTKQTVNVPEQVTNKCLCLFSVNENDSLLLTTRATAVPEGYRC